MSSIFDKFVRKEHKRSKDALGEVVRVKTLAREEFMDLVNREVNLIWNEGKKKIKDKVELS